MLPAHAVERGPHKRVGAFGFQFGQRLNPEWISHIVRFSGSYRIRQIVKRSPGYSGNANPRARSIVIVQSCDHE
ncbi:unnamed protein product [Prunus armeniaca]